MQLNKEQVKGLYDKYEIDMEMFNYVIEPYLSYAVNTLPPKYAPKQDQINQWMKFMISNDCLNEDFIGQNWKWLFLDAIASLEMTYERCTWPIT